ncbi:MAG: hypothetical protein WD055_02545 [Candidatus Dependentiae bacterium]
MHRFLLASKMFCLIVLTGTHLMFGERSLVEHVKKCIEFAKNDQSKLTPEALSIEGMTSRKVKHLLNNICTLENSTYFEIGTWKGSTFIASLYGNGSSVVEAVACDNWSLFGGPKQEFKRNCSLINDVNYRFYEQDCFVLDKDGLFENPVNIYFYDGEHTVRDQERAFTYFNDVFADTFIAIVDDWNFPNVPKGTRAAFQKLEYTILYEIVLPAKKVGDPETWWNGLYVAVLSKKT